MVKLFEGPLEPIVLNEEPICHLVGNKPIKKLYKFLVKLEDMENDKDTEKRLFRGLVICHECKLSRTITKYSDATWIWDGMLRHKVRVHNVHPTAAFVRYVMDFPEPQR